MKPTTRRSIRCVLTSSTIAGTTWPATMCVSSLTRSRFAWARAAASTGAKRWSASACSSSTSSMLAAKRGSSSTAIMWSSARWRLASRIAASSAFKAPLEPSLATRILLYTGHSFPYHARLGLDRYRRLERLERGLEPALRDQSRHHGTADHGGQEEGVLGGGEEVVGETEECGDRAEGEAGRHHERRVHPLPPLEAEDAGERQDADELRRHLDREIGEDQARGRDDHVGAHERARLEEIERREHREGDHADAMGELLVLEEDRRQHHADEIGRQHGLALGRAGEA